MKNISLLTILLIIILAQANAQPPYWDWARGGVLIPTNAGTPLYNIATDNTNNVYLTGAYNDSVTLGSYVLTGNHETFLAKYDLNGNLQWAKTSTGGTLLYGSFNREIATDAFGNIYVTGSFSDTVSFGLDTIISPIGSNLFLVKYDSSGNVLWAKSSAGHSAAVASGVATDAQGNIYITGCFHTTSITLGSFTLANAGNYNIFIAKYDSSGNVIWAKRAGSVRDDEGLSVATDSFSNVYITGIFLSSSVLFGTDTLINAGFNSADIFLAKYDSGGTVLWAKSAGGTNYDFGIHVATDSSNNVYLTGYYASSSIIFGSYTLINAGNNDAFLTKYNPSGNVLWAKNIGGTSDEFGYCVAADKFNKVYVTGGFNSPSLNFDTIPVQYPTGGTDPMYLAEYDSSGHVIFAKALSSGGNDWNAVTSSPSGCIYVTGGFQPDSFAVGNDTLLKGTINAAVEGVFVAKLCNIPVVANFSCSDSNFCAEGENNCINFFDHSTGTPTAWQWYFTGGVPATSSQQNPTNICYSTAGTYPVTLIVTNGGGGGYDTLTISSMITVSGSPAPPVITVSGSDTLICSHAVSYQWYLNGSAISGATDSFYVWNQGGTYSVQITDSSGCTSLSAGMTITVVGELNNGAGVSVYPNPFDNMLIITAKGNEEFEITLFDITSRKLLSQSFANSATINTEQLVRGVYFYEVRDKQGITGRGKLVKE